jgi:type I restriction enzyme R subunit
MRNQQELGNPTVMIMVDRVDLDTQITATFNTAEVPNVFGRIDLLENKC